MADDQRIEGPTPAGGAYAILYSVGNRAEIWEYDAQGNVIARTYGTIDLSKEDHGKAA